MRLVPSSSNRRLCVTLTVARAQRGLGAPSVRAGRILGTGEQDATPSKYLLSLLVK